MPAETHMEGAPIERDEVLDLVRERLADILEIDPAGIAEGAAFADDTRVNRIGGSFRRGIK